MEGLLIFVSIIIIVFGILQIMLFFKLWKMTNDVKRIKNNLIDGADASIDTAKKEIMLGNNGKAFDIYHKCFINDIMKIYDGIMSAAGSVGVDKEEYVAKYQKICEMYQKEIAKLGNQYLMDYSRFDTVDKMSAIML